MTGGRKVVALSDEAAEISAETDAQSVTEDIPLELDDSWEEAPDEEFSTQSRWREWIAPGLALLAFLGWSGFFGWVNRTAITAALTPSQAIALLSDWALPALLIAVGWLVFMRSSRRETARFGDAARLLNHESTQLEARLSAVNGELSLAREFIAAQSRDIEALGRVAVERISQHAERLSELVAQNSQRVETIGEVSTTALENMEKLRGQLPVIASSAKDVTNQIGNAGRTAHAQLDDMVNGFTRLNEFGQASERQAIALTGKIDESLATFAARSDELDSHLRERLDTLQEGNRLFWAELAEREGENLAALRIHIASLSDQGAQVARALRDAEETALSDWQEAIERFERGLRDAIERVTMLDERAVASAQQRIEDLAKEAEEVDGRLAERDRLFNARVEERQNAAEARHSALMAQINAQLEAFDAIVAAHREEQENHSTRVAADSEALAVRLDQLSQRLDTIAGQSGQAVSALTASHEALEGAGETVSSLTDGSVRLLELIQASVEHSRNELPRAIALGDERLVEIEQRALALREAVALAEGSGGALADRLEAGRQALSELDRLHGTIGERHEHQVAHLQQLGASLAEVDAQSRALADQARNDLAAAIETLNGSAREAVANIGAMSDETIGALAARLGAESGAAIERAIEARAGEAAGQLEAAAARAAELSTDATKNLRDQLARVDELAGNLERRVAQARERAEEQVDHDFARRVALITESLNSNAIDIARALDAEVTDTAWAAYLKGDRGVFTRRAVRLLQPGEAKAVAQLYQSDTGFRDHVSRYIHDFEAMLRQLLSTRDGHALGVTLLSSDMGKLYVAVAQAIERLRN